MISYEIAFRDNEKFQSSTETYFFLIMFCVYIYTFANNVSYQFILVITASFLYSKTLSGLQRNKQNKEKIITLLAVFDITIYLVAVEVTTPLKKVYSQSVLALM